MTLSDSGQVAVRTATTADVAGIVELEEDAFPLDPWSSNLISEAVAGIVPTLSVLVAAGPNEKFCGYAVVSVVDVDAELQRIAVWPEMRRSGVAGRLLSGVHDVATAGGAERLLLEVREDNLSALRFYDRHGFTEVGRRPRYYRDGTTAVVMSAPATMVSVPSPVTSRPQGKVGPASGTMEP